MYNQEQKTRYINDNMERKDFPVFEQNMKNWFGKTAPVEEKLKKDLSEFTALQILSLYRDTIHTSSSAYLTWMHGYFRDYASWAKSDENHFGEIDADTLRMCVDQDAARAKIILREQLLEELKLLKNAMERVLILGLFEGMHFSDFDDLTPEHINTETNEVNIPNGHKMIVSKELVHDMLLAADTYETDEPSGRTRETMLDPNDRRIIKQMRAFPNADRMTRYRRLMQKIRDKYDVLWADAAELPQSGAASMLMDFCKAEHNFNIEEVAKEHLQEICDKYGMWWKCGPKFRRKYGYLFQ